VPRQEFGRAQTVSISGTSIGQMLAYPTTTWIIEAFSWPVVFYFTFSLAVSGYWTIPLELAPRAVGAVGGVMNTMGNCAGLFGPMVAGFIVTQTGSWITLFYVATACGLVSSLIFTLLVSTDPIQIAGLGPETAAEEIEARAGLGH